MLLDLGSGEGDVLTTALGLVDGLHGFGVDIDATLCETARKKTAALNMTDRCEYWTGSFLDRDIQLRILNKKPTLVFLYLTTAQIKQKLQPFLLEMLQHGFRLATYLWTLESLGMAPVAVDPVMKVYLYTSASILPGPAAAARPAVVAA